MYNSEIKERFIKGLDSSLKSNKYLVEKYSTLFNQTNELEKSHGEDLYNLPLNIALEYLMDNYRISSLVTLKHKAGYIRSYKRWALVNNLMKEDAKCIEDDWHVVRNVFYGCDNRVFFRTPAEFRDYLESKMPVKGNDANVIDELAMAYMMLIYSGFGKRDAFYIKLEDVFLTDNYLLVKNEKHAINIYEEFRNVLEKLYSTRIYESRSQRNRGRYKMTDYYLSNGKLDQEICRNGIREYISRNSITKSKKISFDDIYYMGAVYRFKTSGKNDKNELYKIISLDMPKYSKEQLTWYYDNW